MAHKTGRRGGDLRTLLSLVRRTVLPPGPPLPSPIAGFDFLYYTFPDATIVNTVAGQPDGTINEPLNNTFVSGANSYLSMYYDPFPGQCGNLTLPTYTVRTLEVWWQYPAGLPPAGQYILDARVGSTGYWISSNSAGAFDNIGAALVDAVPYFNTVAGAPLTAGATPDTLNALSGAGWQQMVLVLAADETDDITLFSRFSGEQGTISAELAECYVYDYALTAQEIKDLYNAKCSRYGLPFV